ncbi:MAG: VWA domain-containing protein [Acidobacteriales bacterium]|nr:VWA domain-containing protein [Terriglobales bacterium]
MRLVISGRRLVCGTLLLPVLCGGAWGQRRGGAPAGGGIRTAPTTVRDPGAAYGLDTGTTPLYSSNGQVRHAEDEGKVEFRSETVLIEVPTGVTDRSGRPVTGLTKDDFKIYENGAEQKITAFEEISAKSTNRIDLSGKVNANTYTNLTAAAQQSPQTVVMVAIDSVNTPFLDQAYGRKQLIKFLAQRLTPGQPVEIVSIGQRGLRSISGLTYDSQTLIAALKKVSGETPALQGLGPDAQASVAAAPLSPSGLLASAASPAPLDGSASDLTSRLQQFVDQGEVLEAAYLQSNAIETTMQSFLSLAWSVSGIPERKALIWATAGFPFFIDSPSAIPAGNLGPLYERTMQALNDAEISVYPVDVRGLVNYSPNAQPDSVAPSTGPQQTRQIINRSWLQTSQIGTLNDFAEMTGGRAFYNSNDVAGGFRKAVAEASSYYLLGYYLNTHNDRAGWRKLKVTVNKKDLQARARSGFLVTNATLNPERTHVTDEGFALRSPFDSTAIPLTVQVGATTPQGDKKKIEFAYHMPVSGITIQEGSHNEFNLDFITEARSNNQPAGHSAQVAHGVLTPEALAKIKSDGIYFRNSLELPPGQYQVRCLVRDNVSGRIGTVSAPVTVN